MGEADLEDDRRLLLEVESVLKGLRIAASVDDDDARLRLAVEELRKTSRRLKAPSIDSHASASELPSLSLGKS